MAWPIVYPFVKMVWQPRLLSRGPWEAGRPVGVTVHHAADRDMQRVLMDGKTSGLGYHLIIDRAGLVTQAAYMDERVDHAGDAEWNGHSPNRNHLAVCVLSWGRVNYTPSGFVVWAKGQPLLDPSACALRPDNLGGPAGWWDACTTAQEATLMSVLRWAVATGIDPANICGHDECALPLGRKDDPGGALSQRMVDVRKSLMVHPA